MISRVMAIVILVFGYAQSEEADPQAAQVIELDKELNQIILDGHAMKAAPFYMDDFVLITSSGKAKTKQDLLSEIKMPSLKFEVNETSGVKVRVHGNTAVLTGLLHQKGIANATPFDSRFLVTDTWIRTGNTWRLLSGHACRAPENQ